ncbi:MAG TPA: TonB-dependent receptor [Nannocystaceae bacterium]|nr:TonB-dependent receptor [Nannocystaceae bacterium]
MASLVCVAPSARAQASRGCIDVADAPAAATRSWPAPLDARVSLGARGISMRDALEQLSARSGVALAYSSDLLPLDRAVCVVAARQPLGRVLAALLAGTRVAASVVAGRVALVPASETREQAPARVSMLERVVVTGSAVAASRRPLTVGVTVIEGETLRRAGTVSLAEALDASVPGLWLWEQSPSSLVAQYGSVRGASSFSTSYPKMYIDGIEVANPQLVTQIDPDVIERVEVIRGPQGSALYGSDAIGGVINVVTRHDGAPANGTHVQVSSLAGASASDFGPRLVPTHEQRVALRGGSDLGSAGLAIAFGQTGAVFPSAQSRQLSLGGDARRVTSAVTLVGSARLFDRTAGRGHNPLLTGLRPALVAPESSDGSGSSTPASDDAQASSELTSGGDQHVRLYTIGASAAFATRGAWTHTLVAGLDGYRLANVADATNPFGEGVDAALRGADGGADRTTFRASSVAQLGAGTMLPTTLTFGIEHSALLQRSTIAAVGASAADDRNESADERVKRAWRGNVGAVAQASTAWRDAIFLTGGLRVEHNDAFSGRDQFPVLPLLGAAIVRSVGPVEVKLRSAYGKGIRPPRTPAGFSWEHEGPRPYVRLGLDPEVQSGIETGIELYAGDAFSLQATRFDQRATGLIQNVAITVETQLRSGTSERRMLFLPMNVGEITNRGWELQAGVHRGALALTGTFSTVDSRVRAVVDDYRGDLRAGDRMLGVPAHTASVGATWIAPRWSAALSAARAADWINYDRIALARAYAGTDDSPQRDVTGARLREFWRSYGGATHLRATASRDVGRGLTLLVVGDNLLGEQLGEPDNLTIRQGRTVSGGLRASF